MDRNKIVDLIKDFVNEYGVNKGNGKCIICKQGANRIIVYTDGVGNVNNPADHISFDRMAYADILYILNLVTDYVIISERWR